MDDGIPCICQHANMERVQGIIKPPMIYFTKEKYSVHEKYRFTTVPTRADVAQETLLRSQLEWLHNYELAHNC